MPKTLEDQEDIVYEGGGGNNGDSHRVKDLGFFLELKARIPKEAYSAKYCN